MIDFYRVKFSIYPHNGSIENCFEEIITIIRRWLEAKYTPQKVSGIIPDWDEFTTGGSFGNNHQIGSFSAETISYHIHSNNKDSAWACRIEEYSRKSLRYASQRWITEIGYRVLSPKNAEVSYYVCYENIFSENNQAINKPNFNIPKAAQNIIMSDKWKCIADAQLFDAVVSHYKPFKGKLFGLVDCRNLIESSKVEEIVPVDKRWISLCRVNRPDKNDDIWLRRFADCIDGRLTAFVLNENKDQIFDNRPYIFRKDGPSKADSIGFWEWYECQNQYGTWQSNSSFLSDLIPIEFIYFDGLSDIEEIIETLKSGTTIPSYMSGNIMFSFKKDGKIKGVLCDLSSFTVRPGENFYITIKSDIYTLPYYEFDESDIFQFKNRKVLKSIQPGEPIRMIPVFSVTDSIKQLLLSNMTWPVFKAKGITRSDWQKMKEFLDAIPKDSILDKLAQTYAMTIDEAQARVDSFLHNVEKYLTAEDVNAETMVSMIECHSGLREKSIAAGEKQWKLTHTEQIEEAESQLETIRKSISAAEDDKIHLLMEIEAAQEKLDQLRAEIVRNEALGRDTVDATRRKIADAQKNMAGFIAELSAFMPFGSFSHSDTAIDSQYIHPADRRYSEDDFEMADNWNSEYNVIFQNLSSALRIDSEICAMLSAFLYSAYLHKEPLLIAGPGGTQIADILSVSLSGKESGKLLLGNNADYGLSDKLSMSEERIIAIRNMFGKGWSDDYPSSIAMMDKQILWTHPFVEDLQIEPKGLYNYMLPIFSECFIGAFDSCEPIPGKRSEDFKGFIPGKPKPLRIPAIRKLGLSRWLLNRLERILSDAKAILSNPAKERDLDVLFGLLPLSVLTGRTDILQEYIESETGISGFVKAEAGRYYSEE